jgi:hypothetical protein
MPSRWTSPRRIFRFLRGLKLEAQVGIQILILSLGLAVIGAVSSFYVAGAQDANTAASDAAFNTLYEGLSDIHQPPPSPRPVPSPSGFKSIFTTSASDRKLFGGFLYPRPWPSLGDAEGLRSLRDFQGNVAAELQYALLVLQIAITLSAPAFLIPEPWGRRLLRIGRWCGYGGVAWAVIGLLGAVIGAS